MDGGEEEGDERAERVADDVHGGELQRVAEREQVVGMVGDAVAMGRFAAVAAPAQVRRDGVPTALGQSRPGGGPALAAGGQAVDEQNSALRAGKTSPGDIMEGDALQVDIMGRHGGLDHSVPYSPNRQ